MNTDQQRVVFPNADVSVFGCFDMESTQNRTSLTSHLDVAVVQEAAVEAQPPLDLHGAPLGHVILHPLLPGKPHLLHPALVP